MSVSKKFLKTKNSFKCTFRLPKSAAPDSEKVFIVGEFNDWAPEATPMQKLKSGDFKAELELEPGKSYQFRYLIDKERDVWENDWEADAYVPAPGMSVENSVVQL